MKILITGTAGFIGMHLANTLLDQGHEVVGVDNFNDYYSVKLKQDRHAVLEKRDGYVGLNLDLVNFECLTKAFSEHKPDIVCNLAAQAGVRYSLTNPFVYQKSNLEGFLSILEACRHAPNKPRLVYASSSSVYGGNKKMPFSEEDRVDNPVSLYAATKKANELMAHCYSHLYDMQTIGLRFFTVYGPWGRPDMALWLFTKAMLAGKPIKVFNHGKMKRDFTYIDDIITGVVNCLFADNFGKYEVFNIGNHQSEKLMDMIQVISDSLGIEPKMEMLPMQDGDVPATYADIDKLNKLTGYEPTTPISVGIPKFIEWYKEYHGV